MMAAKSPEKVTPDPAEGSGADDNHSCHVCNIQFPTWRNLLVHLKKHKGRVTDLYRCSLCPETFGESQPFHIHLGTAHPQDYLLIKYKRPDKTTVVTASRRKLNCPYCSMKFINESNLKPHLRTHTGEGLYICETCGAALSSSKALKGHKAAKHPGEYGIERKSISCEGCDQMYKTRATLREHQQKTGHRNSDLVFKPKPRPPGWKPKSYICLFCGKDMKTSSGLMFHNLSHTGEKPFSCSACGRTYGTKSGLRLHTLRICKGMVAMGVNRKKSMVKPKVKVVKCPQCNFMSPPAKLCRHTKHHGTDFICEHCQVGFNNKRALLRHKMAEHPDLTCPFKCEEEDCGARLTSAQGLSRHIYLYHKGGKEGKNNVENSKNDSSDNSTELSDSIISNLEKDEPEFKLEVANSVDWGEEMLEESKKYSEDPLALDIKPCVVKVEDIS